MTGADHTFIFGLANDHIGYQVPFAKWDNSCHACAPYILAACEEPVRCSRSTATRCSRTTSDSKSTRPSPVRSRRCSTRCTEQGDRRASRSPGGGERRRPGAGAGVGARRRRLAELCSSSATPTSRGGAHRGSGPHPRARLASAAPSDRDGDGSRGPERQRAPGAIAFVPHGHGVAEYARGEEVVLFLHRIERVRELATTPSRAAWGGCRCRRARTSSLTARARSVPRRRPRLRRRRRPARGRATRRAPARDDPPLASHEPRLSASAVRDLALAADPPLVGAADLPALEPLLTDARVAIGTRIALLAELERRRLVVGPSAGRGSSA